MRKFLVSVFVFVLSFVLILVPSFASSVRESDSASVVDFDSIPFLEPTRDSTSYSSGSIFVASGSGSVSSSFAVHFDFIVGTYSNTGFVAADSDIVYDILYVNALANNLYSIAGYDSDTRTSVYLYQPNLALVFNSVKIVSDFSFPSSLENILVLVQLPFPSFVFSSTSSVFDSVLGFADTLISFIADNWIAIIPLVLWVLIALFGVFRKLFKGL